jgi:hypothetical protein
VLGGAVAVGLAGLPALSACSSEKPPAPPAPSPDVAVLTGAIAAEQSLVALYGEVIAAHPGLRTRLNPALVHHQAHLSALRAYYRPATGVRSPSPSASITPAPEVPSGQSAALAALRTAEQNAAAARAREVTKVPAALAQLLASVGACEAGHATLLATT